MVKFVCTCAFGFREQCMAIQSYIHERATLFNLDISAKFEQLRLVIVR